MTTTNETMTTKEPVVVLTGSEKQIKWATDIKTRYIAQAEKVLSRYNKDFTGLSGEAEAEEDYEYKMDAYDAEKIILARHIVNWLNQQNNAGKIIAVQQRAGQDTHQFWYETTGEVILTFGKPKNNPIFTAAKEKLMASFSDARNEN